MKLFSIFKRNKSNLDPELVVIGWLRTETSELLGLEANTKEYNDACKSAGERLQLILLPFLDKQSMQDVANTLSSISSGRFEEMFGQYILVLFLRFCVISNEIVSGRVKLELKEATPDILADVLHTQLKNIIKQLK